jgi:hypothetical protein
MSNAEVARHLLPEEEAARQPPPPQRPNQGRQPGRSGGRER